MTSNGTGRLRSAPCIPVHISRPHADKPALIMGRSGFTQTFAELDAAANRSSRLLRAAGLQPGDHVALCMENHARYLEVVWGCHYAGLVYTARRHGSQRRTRIHHQRLRAKRLHHLEVQGRPGRRDRCRHARRRVAADARRHHRRVRELRGRGRGPAARAARRPRRRHRHALLVGHHRPAEGRAPAVPETPLEDGGTGVLGLVQLLFAIDDTKVYLSPAPLYHAAPLRFCLAAHALGGTVVAMEHFDAEEYLSLVEKYRITHSQVVPTMFVRMLKLPEEVRAKYDVSSLECVIHAAAPCPVAGQAADDRVVRPGRSTSTTPAPKATASSTATARCGWPTRARSARRSHCTVHIVGDDGEDLPQGETGTVYFEGGATFEYHNDPEKTKGSRHPKGWSTLGDVGYLDADDFLYLTDRKAYMIISGGVNIYPQEAENVLVDPPEGGRRRRVRGAQRRLRRRGQGGRAARRDARRRRGVAGTRAAS